VTALKPIENRRVRAVASERYPLNEYCASPMSEAGVKADDPHHCFPRSQIGGDSWFVEIINEGDIGTFVSEPIPHVVGLSREQHERVERHEAWIKLEDGVWNWYERHEPEVPTTYDTGEGPDWVLIGPLNPQPGSREGKPKRKRKQGDERRKRKVISIRVPDDEEDGAAIWDETLDDVKDRLVREGLKDRPEDLSVYVALVAALRDWLNG